MLSEFNPLSFSVRNIYCHNKTLYSTYFEQLLLRSMAIPRDMLLSKELYIKAGGYRHELSIYEDWDFKLRLSSLVSTWIYTHQIGTIYVQHSTGLSKHYKRKDFLLGILHDNSTLIKKITGRDVSFYVNKFTSFSGKASKKSSIILLIYSKLKALPVVLYFINTKIKNSLLR